MESVSITANKQLVYLTSREGDSYLDEMLSLIENCAHLMRANKLATNLMGEITDPLKSGIDALDSLEIVFRSLKEVVNELPLFEIMSTCFADSLAFADLSQRFKDIDIDGFFAAISREGFQQFEFLTVTFYRTIKKIKKKSNFIFLGLRMHGKILFNTFILH